MHTHATLLPTDPASPAMRALLSASDRHMATLYPAESNHMADPAALAVPGALFLGAWLDGEAAACAAVLPGFDGVRYGEIKRVYVSESCRGRGVARALMARLEEHLRAQGVALARLETGVRQPEALALYRALGYRERGPFGEYGEDSLSVFMEKVL